ncbi:MOSC domain-containing protein [Anaerobacillus isosaccharinicus]|uniref:MOSC domain-containing protein n=1 Tax=Anaerobacillus isosaccharinicus TaxID=1532552 RepID=A0A7S7RE14_9BACI
MPDHGSLKSINIGKVQVLNQTIKTGLLKSPIHENEIILVTDSNLFGDEQADLINHGGPDKAICVYSYDHYSYWEEALKTPLPLGAFGENFTVHGLTEKDVLIGDVFQIGEAIVQVSQPRQPCYKLAKRFNKELLPLIISNTGYTGYYLRVLNPGKISLNDSLTFLDRPSHNITVAFVNEIKYLDKENKEAIEKLVQLQELAENLRNSFSKRL